jgi:fluoroacetyl-CoA thioesterase
MSNPAGRGRRSRREGLATAAAGRPRHSRIPAMVMARRIKRGMEGSATCICTEANTARAMKSGSLDVFATPSMVALMEQAACNALRATAEEEGKAQGLSSSSVGTAMSVEHLAATSLGRTVVARATITAVGPKQRSVTFDVVASDSTGSVIGRGTHQRVIVGTERFMAKASSRQEQAVGGVEIRPFQPADLPQVHALFAAGMRHYHAAIPADRPQRDKFIEQWNAYIDHSIASDLGPEMGGTYLDSPRSGFWCAVDQRPDTPVPGAIIGIVGADEHCEHVSDGCHQ